MNLTDAETMAHDAFAEWGLDLLGWSFGFDRAVIRFGYCVHATKRITISRALTLANNEEEVRDTILHEVAHALVGSGAGHGYRWQAKAVEVGARPSKCYSLKTVRPATRWVLKCDKCGIEVARARRDSRSRYHVRDGGNMSWAPAQRWEEVAEVAS